MYAPSSDHSRSRTDWIFSERSSPVARSFTKSVWSSSPFTSVVYAGHDTPSDNLFDKLTRDLSHGCVRLEQPVELAAYVLRDQPEWTAARIQAAMHAGKEEHVALTTPIAVHLVYLTARVDEDGVPQFFDDVYGYDGKQQELSGASVRTGAANAEPAHDVATGH